MRTIILLLLLCSCGKPKDDGGGIINNPPKTPPISDPFTPANDPIVPTQTTVNYVNNTVYYEQLYTAEVGAIKAHSVLYNEYLKFETTAHQYNLTISLTNLDLLFDKTLPTRKGSSVAGFCFFSNGKPIIQINPYKWEEMNSDQREVLIFHELGHCLLNKVHNENNITHNSVLIPQSIMKSMLIDSLYYSLYKNYYLDQLFQ